MTPLVNAAAWIAALATVLWQRILLPLITRHTPEFLELFAPPQQQLALAPAPVTTPVLVTPPQQEPIPINRPRRKRKSSADPTPIA